MGKELGFRSMQNPRVLNMAFWPHITPPLQRLSWPVDHLKWVWALRVCWCGAEWMRNSTPKSCSSARETSSSGVSLSLERSVTWRSVFSFLDRFRAIQGTKRYLYDFHLLINRFNAILNIQKDLWQQKRRKNKLVPSFHKWLPASFFKIKSNEQVQKLRLRPHSLIKIQF